MKKYLLALMVIASLAISCGANSVTKPTPRDNLMETTIVESQTGTANIITQVPPKDTPIPYSQLEMMLERQLKANGKVIITDVVEVKAKKAADADDGKYTENIPFNEDVSDVNQGVPTRILKPTHTDINFDNRACYVRVNYKVLSITGSKTLSTLKPTKEGKFDSMVNDPLNPKRINIADQLGTDWNDSVMIAYQVETDNNTNPNDDKFISGGFMESPILDAYDILDTATKELKFNNTRNGQGYRIWIIK